MYVGAYETLTVKFINHGKFLQHALSGYVYNRSLLVIFTQVEIKNKSVYDLNSLPLSRKPLQFLQVLRNTVGLLTRT